MMIAQTGQKSAGADEAKGASRDPRDLRYRKRFFPGAQELVFDTTTKGYAPLPILLRKVLRHLTPPEIRVLLYLYTRASKYRICYPSIEDIADELGVNRKNVTPHIASLEHKQLIRVHTEGSRKYFLILDPAVAIKFMASTGEIDERELYAINDLCEELNRPSFEIPPGKR